MPRKMKDILASLQPNYAAEQALIAKQQAALPGEEQAMVGGLEQAKTNAFADITNQANERGMLYSGMPISEQARYTGERFLPALAGVRSDIANRRFKLEEALIGTQQRQRAQAEDIYSGEIRAEAEAQERAERMALERQKLAQRPAKEPSSAQRQQAFNQDLISVFRQVESGQIPYRPFIREQVAQKLAAEYGMPIDQALKQTRTLFTDSWDSGQQVKGGYRQR
jgi:hypothetical protein